MHTPMNIECLNFLIARNIYRNITSFSKWRGIIRHKYANLRYPLEKIVNLSSKKFR